jgi:hypothetical protein
MVLQAAVANGNKVSSVGAVGKMAFDERNKRIKGIAREVVRTSEGLSAIFSRAAEAEGAHPQATRTTFRAFVDRGLIEDLRKAERLLLQEGAVRADAHHRADGTAEASISHLRRQRESIGVELGSYFIEAVIPTNGAVDGCDLVYFGKNSLRRTPSEKLRQDEQESLSKVQASTQAVRPADAIARATEGGYAISLSEGSQSQEDLRALLNLYHEAYELYTFEVNEQTIQVMVGNGNKVLSARGADGSIASVLIAEECAVELEGGQRVTIYELSDFATFRKDRGNGLITALQIEAVRILRELDPHAIIYAEDRAPWMPVNKSSKEAGLEYGGTLPFHCALISDRNFDYNGGNRQYESLNVWYAPFNGSTASTS